MLIDEHQLPAYARGCGILGAGGGGSSRVAQLLAHGALSDHGPVSVVAAEDLDPDGLVLPLGGIGSPTVGLERLGSGREPGVLRRAMERETGLPVVAVMCVEIGGGNGVLPVAWAAMLGLPLLDADGMGRAFPEAGQVAMRVRGVPSTPAAMTDETGRCVVIRNCGPDELERVARAVASAWGGLAVGADHAFSGREASRVALTGTVSLALRLGRSVGGVNPVASVVEVAGGRLLLRGKVSEIDRSDSGGFLHGRLRISGTGADAHRELQVDIRNEFLAAWEHQTIVASVPDLICVLDDSSGEAIGSESVRYGQRVSVVGLPCQEIWRTGPGLRVAGPRAFGYQVDHTPVERACHVA